MARRPDAVIAWLLLLPAAVLMVAFTHYPAVATLWHSLHSTPRGNRPARWVGLAHYRALADDPVFWTSLVNNAWYALGTIVPSIALALVMAVLDSGALAEGRQGPDALVGSALDKVVRALPQRVGHSRSARRV